MPRTRDPAAGRPALAVLCGLDDPVRRRLYEYVSGCTEPAGRDEVAAATGVGRPLAAYHLDKLVDLGLLTAEYRRPPGRRGGPGAGRPAKVYARSGGEFSASVPARDYELAARLLAAAVEADPGGTAMAALTEAARDLGIEIGKPAAPGVVESILRAHGFEPYPAGRDGIALRNCPFRRLAAEHPAVVCAMNQALLGGVLRGLGADGLDALLEPAPDRCCVVIRTRTQLDQEAADPP